MTNPRFYVPVPLSVAAPVALPAAAAHHAVRVLRLQVDASLTLFNGAGGEYAARIISISKLEVVVNIERHDAVERESPLAVALVQALSSGERMDLTIQKAVELGVAQIVPVETERCVVRLQGERAVKRVQHWQQIVISACEQCGRNRLPVVSPILSIDAWLASSGRDTQRWLLSPRAPQALRELPLPTKPIELLVGPEGGFTDAEMAAAQRARYEGVRLGPRVLRTETAAPALLAAVQALWGDF